MSNANLHVRGQEDPDVVIAGAGPTGLMAAALLSRCGMSVRILNKDPGQAKESRAFAVQARSMELFLSMGLADEFLQRGIVAAGGQIFVDSRQVAEINFDDIGRADTPYSFVLLVPQWDVEDILVKDLAKRRIAVEHNMEVTGFTQSSDGVVVQARDSAGKTDEIHGSFLIGADGAHSVVRKMLGLSFEGAPYPLHFLLADCHVEWPLDYEHLKFFLRDTHLAVYFPLRGKEICRWVSAVPANSQQAQGAEDVSLEEVQESIRLATGMEIRLTNPQWLARYRVHHRGVNKYGEGRVFVGGDAAHIHSPAGGQGMNTGLQDMANLCWKLAAVHRGKVAHKLLDTYHAERWPVGQKVLHTTDKIFSAVAAQHAWTAKLRNLLMPIFAATIAHSGTARAKAFHFISQLGIHYHDNDFIREDASDSASKEWRDGLTAGHRAPNGLVTREVDIFRLIGGYRFHVLAFSRTGLSSEEIGNLEQELAALPRFIGLDIETHIVAQALMGRNERIVRAESTQAFEAYCVTRKIPQALYLIRPDGYIAYRADGLDIRRLRAFLARNFAA